MSWTPPLAPAASRCCSKITTAGYDRHSICFEHHDYAIKLLEGVLQQAERWIDMTAWDACSGPVDLEQLPGKPASAASTSPPPSTSPRSPGFPPKEDDLWRVLSRYFVPEESLQAAERATACPTTSGPGRASLRRPRATSSTTVPSRSEPSPMPPCSRSGRSRTTPGTPPTSRVRLQDEGATMVEFRQGFRSMAAPTPRAGEADRLEEARTWRQPGHPPGWRPTSPSPRTPPATLSPPRTRAPNGSMVSSRSSWAAHGRKEEPQPEPNAHPVIESSCASSAAAVQGKAATVDELQSQADSIREVSASWGALSPLIPDIDVY
jgi:hypothetical protein